MYDVFFWEGLIYFLSSFYGVLLLIKLKREDRKIRYSNSNNKKKTQNKEILKLSYKIFLIIVLFLFMIIIKKGLFLFIYSFIYHLFVLLSYMTLLISILLEKEDKKVKDDNTLRITIMPCIFMVLLKMKISREIIAIIQSMCNEKIMYLIVFKTIKSFGFTFFILLDLFLIISELNDLIHINWKSFTTDFEIALITAFKKSFDFIPNLKHNGCFFHYMKNIYKYLVKNKYTVKSNKNHYSYIIKNVYELPFKVNIEKNIDKEIKKNL